MMLDDALATGNGFMFDGKRVDPVLVRVTSLSVSPDLASLAAKYVNIDTLELMDLDRADAFELCMDVRSLAASVLAQAEGTPRK